MSQSNDKNNQNASLQPVDAIDVSSETDLLKRIGQMVIEGALKKGASQVEVGVSKDIGLSVEVRNQDVDTIEYNRDNNFGLTVYFGQKKGTANTSDLSEKSLYEALDAACSIAKYTQDDPCSGLADKALMARHPVDLKLDMPMGCTAESAKELALTCEQAGLAVSNKISQSEGATFSSHRNIRYYANSHQFSAAIASTRHSLSCSLIAENNQGMQRDYWYSISRDPNLLESSNQVGEKAADRVLRRLNQKKIATQKAPVLMVPEVARGLIANFCSGIQGSALYRKSSFLLNSLNQSIFPDFVNFEETPLLIGGLASTWFDSEGVATRAQKIVENGIVKTYLLNSYSARRLGMETTGHAGGVHNLQVSAMPLGFDDLVKKMQKGFVVTDLMGQGVNLVTGDYSRGAAGFWVENGEIQHFVDEVTIAGNLKDMFANLVAIGNDFDTRSSTLTGSWLLEEMTIAGN